MFFSVPTKLLVIHVASFVGRIGAVMSSVVSLLYGGGDAGDPRLSDGQLQPLDVGMYKCLSRVSSPRIQ